MSNCCLSQPISISVYPHCSLTGHRQTHIHQKAHRLQIYCHSQENGSSHCCGVGLLYSMPPLALSAFLYSPVMHIYTVNFQNSRHLIPTMIECTLIILLQYAMCLCMICIARKHLKKKLYRRLSQLKWLGLEGSMLQAHRIRHEIEGALGKSIQQWLATSCQGLCSHLHS